MKLQNDINETINNEKDANTDELESILSKCEEEENSAASSKNYSEVTKKQVDMMKEYRKLFDILEQYKDVPKTELPKELCDELDKMRRRKDEITLYFLDSVHNWILSVIRAYYGPILLANGYITSYNINHDMPEIIEDMVCETRLLIIQKLYDYDPEKTRFITYCRSYIKQAITEYGTEYITNKKSKYFDNNSRKIIKAKKQLDEEGKDMNNIYLLSELTGLTPKVISNTLSNEMAAERVNIDDINESQMVYFDTPEQNVIKQEERKFLVKLLELLSPIEKYVVLERCGIESSHKKSYKEISIDPYFVSMVKRDAPEIRIRHGNVEVKKMLIKDIDYISEMDIKLIETEALKKLRTAEQFNQHYSKNVLNTEAVTIININEINHTTNIILDDGFDLNDINF